MWFRRRTDCADQAEVDRLVTAFDNACSGAGVCRTVNTVSGPTEILPRITYVILGPPTRLTVRMPVGMVWSDVRDAADRLAPHLGAWGLRVEPRGHGEYAVVELLYADPLTEPYHDVPTVGPFLIGRDEHGQDVTITDLPHSLIVGSTGTGKSVAGYSLISQAISRGYRVCGVDPSNTTLRGIPGSVCSLGNLPAVDTHLESLVSEMDQRMTQLPIDDDSLPVSNENPRVLICLDEYPALLRAVDATDKKLATRIRGHVSRLLFEARKVNISVLIMAQRPDAAILGGAERAQAGLRIAYRLDGPDAVRMVMPDAVDQAVDHVSALPGIALAALPGRAVTRIRSPFLTYRDYMSRLTLAGAA